MNPEKAQKLEQHIEAIAALLYEETTPEQVESLGKIEETIREQTLSSIYYTSVGSFFIQKTTGTTVGRSRKIKSIIGKLSISEKQAYKLKVKTHQRISPYLTECCLRASANTSYENASKDVARYTGMIVSGKTQQRLVHRHNFELTNCELPLREISVDGGKVRLRTQTKGESCIWRDAAPEAQSPLGG